MRFATVCSGIEAASAAWEPHGWEPVFFSEIEPFPCAVLAHHYPNVPNYGDMTQFEEWPDADVDVLAGGTPCQSFSVAGLRAGLADPRGNLMLTYLAIARRYRPRWVVWENVPGVLSSNGGRDFGAFLRGLGECGYGFAYRVLDAQFCRTRRFPRAVPQRRRRVFVVGYLGDWRPAAAVLFDAESLRGNPAPRREAGQGTPQAVGGGPDRGGIAGTVSSKWAKGSGGPAGDECYNMVAHALRGEGFDASEDGTGRGTPLVPIAFSAKDYGSDAMDNFSPTLRAGGHSGSHANAGVMPAVAFAQNQRGELRTSRIASQLTTGGGKPGEGYPAVMTPSAVRRLTPLEAERLMGFPDDFTRIPYRNKPADKCPDGPRYKALGNSWAVNCADWLAERIRHFEAILKSEAA